MNNRQAIGKVAHRKSMAVFEAPPVPEGWHGRSVIRVIDPLGIQAAWILPQRLGGVIGYFVRQSPGRDWIEVLSPPGLPGSAGDGPLGCEIIVREPGSRRMVAPDQSDVTWEFGSRDPTEATVRGTIGKRRVIVSTQCEDDGLHVSIHSGAGDDVGLDDVGVRIHSRPEVEHVDQAGAIRFLSGPVTHLAYRHDPDLCDGLEVVRYPNVHQLDFVPVADAHRDHSGIGIVFTATVEPGTGVAMHEAPPNDHTKEW